MSTRASSSPSRAASSKTTTTPAAGAKAARPKPRKKNPQKLVGRFALDFAALRGNMMQRANMAPGLVHAAAGLTADTNPALLRLKALTERDRPGPAAHLGAPVKAALANWTPLGPLAVPGGQTYGGARILISGRVTAIAPHPTNANTIFIGSSRGGVWRTRDGGGTWTALCDNQPSLAIGALAIAASNPDVLYAGTGEGNVQFYSTAYTLDSAPGVYLGVGVLRSSDGGATWALQASSLLSNHSCYRIAVDRNSANRAFAATSRGLCRTTDGNTWIALAGGGLPAISASVIACTDVVIDRGDSTGNTVYAAFWDSGIYKSTNALAASPGFTLLATGLPAGNTTSRISLAQSASSPERKYALVAGSDDQFKGLYRTTTAAGGTWELCTSSNTIALYGAFTSDVNVDPTTPDVVYVSGVELYQCRRNATTGAWAVSNIGGNIHADSHTFAFHPTLNQTIYSGNDGGFFVSRDGGATWDDSPNEGLCLLQYEAIDNHGMSDAFVQCGTQDNGTQQYRNSPVHYHSADGDGGYCAVSKVNGNNVVHAYFGSAPERSTIGGKLDSYTDVKSGLNGNGLFYPPIAIAPRSERMALGTDVINIDDAMGTDRWPGSGVALPGINGRVSAMSFTSDTVFYCATTSGEVYRLDRGGTGTWSARALHAAPLPAGQWIWDVQSLPGAPDTIVVAFSGFGLAQHVWRGTVPASGAATWAAVSSGLPDVPMYALAFSDTPLASPTLWFVGTDIGVYRSTDAGANWANFSQGLPNTAVYDLRLRTGSNRLRAATHGRGLWEVRIEPGAQPTVDLFVRDHIMDVGRASPDAGLPAAWEDPARYVALNDICWWWQSPDIKTDAPPTWQLQPGEVDYFHFETRLVDEHPEKGNQNRVYVQVHNRGPLPAANVTVKIMVTGASAGLPDLPADFWSAWPNSAGDANWTPVGAPQTIASLEALRPAVLQWDWTPSASADTHTCMLVVIDSPSDPIPAATRAVFDTATLIDIEKRAALKNLHVVNLLPDTLHPVAFHLHAPGKMPGPYLLHLPPPPRSPLGMGLLLSQSLSKRFTTAKLPPGLKATRLTATDLKRVKDYWLQRELRSDASWDQLLQTYDTSRVFGVEAKSKGVDLPVPVQGKAGENVLLLFSAGKLKASAAPLAKLTLTQAGAGRRLVGGSTFVLKVAK